jgi:ADP-ribose pyrophosphatase YjhB (NUDIX family)
MLSFSDGDKRFNYRIVGIALRDGHVLLHKEDREDFWSLPGGRAEWHERSEDTLRRELAEELGVEAEVGRLAWVVENFYDQEGQSRHELALYYLLDLPNDPRLADLNASIPGVEPGVPLTFRWFPVERLSEVPVYPTFLAQELKSMSAGIKHIVHRDPSERTVSG